VPTQVAESPDCKKAIVRTPRFEVYGHGPTTAAAFCGVHNIKVFGRLAIFLLTLRPAKNSESVRAKFDAVKVGRKAGASLPPKPYCIQRSSVFRGRDSGGWDVGSEVFIGRDEAHETQSRSSGVASLPCFAAKCLLTSSAPALTKT
jgi:hypothetical protein